MPATHAPQRRPICHYHPAMHPPPSRRRLILRVSLTFLLIALLFCSAAGAMLAAYPQAGSYGAFPYQVDGDHLGDTDRLELRHQADALDLVIP